MRKWMIVGVLVVQPLFATAAQPANSSEQDGRIEKHQITPSPLSGKRFELRLVWRGDTIKEVVIYSLEKSQPIQRISVEGLHDSESGEYFGVQDVNFDGYKDFWLVTSIGVTGNVSKSYWVYDPETVQFREDDELALLNNPAIDTKRQEITTYSIGGCAGEEFIKSTYKYLSGQLTLIKEEEQRCIDGGVYIVRQRQGTEMVETYRGKPPGE